MPRKDTHYDVLGVPRDAKLTDVTRAYNRHKSQVTRDDAAPDLKRETLIREAYETLADPDRREAYDASLVEPDRRHRSRIRAIAIGAAGVAVAGVYFLFLRPAPPPVVAARTSQEILQDASISIARVKAIELSGQATPAGMAFAIGENVLVGSCTGIKPTAQLVVTIPPREVPARMLSMDEELGLCRISAQGVGSRPLAASRTEPKAGDLVYAAKLSEAGKLVLAQGLVKRVLFEPKSRVIESAPAPSGAPLLDAQGQLIGVATRIEGHYIPVPASWISEALVPFKEEAAATPAAEPAPAAAEPRAPQASDAKALQHLTPAQRDKLEKAYRPPPDTRDDWMK